jgi:hypothetical protein
MGVTQIFIPDIVLIKRGVEETASHHQLPAIN